MPTLVLKVESDAAVYRVRVDGKLVVNSKPGGRKTLAAGEHLLTWTMTGSAGNTIQIEGMREEDGVTVVTVPETAIPEDREQAGGDADFEI